MANQIYVVDNLVNSLKLRGLPPSSQQTFTTDGFIQVLSEEMMTNIVPLMDSVSEEYFVTNYDITFDSNTSVYSIPPRAVGGKLRDVVFVDTTNNEINLPRLRPEDIKTRSQFIRYQPAPWGFYIKDNSVVLFLGQTPNTQAGFPILRLKFFRRPNILTASTNAAQITGIIGNAVTVTAVPSAWNTSNTFDLIKGDPGFQSKGDDQTITSIVGTTINFTALPSSVAIGDWVALANYSPIPQIPPEAHLLLAQYGTAKVLEAMGDIAGMSAALGKAEQMKQQFLMIITPRVEGSVIKLVSRSGIGDWMENSGW